MKIFTNSPMLKTAGIACCNALTMWSFTLLLCVSGMSVAHAVTLSGRVFVDVNDNGIQENEPGRNTVYVQLMKVFPNGEQQFVNAVFTNANGEYQFTLPGADNYRVCFGNPGNFYVVSPPNAGNDDVDSDIDDIVGCSTYFTSGSEDIDIDAGFVPGLDIPCGTTVLPYHQQPGVRCQQRIVFVQLECCRYAQFFGLDSLCKRDQHLRRVQPK